MPKFGLKMNSGRSNVKLRGQIILEFYEFAIYEIDETRNPLKLESSDSDLRSERYPIFKIKKIQTKFGWKWRTNRL